LELEKNYFQKYIFTVFSKVLGTKHGVIIQTQCYFFFHKYNE